MAMELEKVSSVGSMFSIVDHANALSSLTNLPQRESLMCIYRVVVLSMKTLSPTLIIAIVLHMAWYLDVNELPVVCISNCGVCIC